MKENLASYDKKIAKVKIEFGPERQGDVPHSLASIEKAKRLLGYDPQFDIKAGLKEVISWYWNNLK